MAHTYMVFDFGADEEKAQQARHKLDGWKQAFRLDKKMQVKFDRGETAAAEAGEGAQADKPKSSAKAKSAKASEKNGSVKLLVRLYFSTHEKLLEERWLKRLPTEELFKEANPRVIHEGQIEFPEVLKQFDSLE